MPFTPKDITRRSSSAQRFDFVNAELQKRRKSLSQPPLRFNFKACLQNFAKHVMTVLVVAVAVGFTWFANYPEPPMSPILYQWQNMSQTFQYKSYNIFYIDKTTEINNGVTVLYLHGFPTSSFDLFKSFGTLVKNVNRIVAPDFLGFGFSDKPRFYDYSVKDQSELIIKLVEHLQLENVHILSHDYGDSVAQELLALKKDNMLNMKLTSVCMMNGGIFPTLHKPILMQKLFRMPIVGTVLSKFANYYMFSHSFSSVFGSFTKPTYTDLYDIWRLIRLNDGYRIWGKLLTYIDERFENEDRWVGAIHDSPVPLHFIYGPADPINQPPFQKTYTEIVLRPSIKVLDKDIGHYPQLEAPDDVMKSYIDFLSVNNFLNATF